MRQIKLFKDDEKAFGGTLMTTARGRMGCRPLNTGHSMHLVLRSTKAVGEWSFKKPKNERMIKIIIEKFSRKYGVNIFSLANVGNHLHFQIKLKNRFTYAPFIRAVTGSIAMAVTDSSRWNPLKSRPTKMRGAKKYSRKIAHVKDRFWDYRPFTRVVQGYRAFLRLKDYIQLNRLEGFGVRKEQGRFLLKMLSHQTSFG
jgi:REP element-mobilizing transposase RayT